MLELENEVKTIIGSKSNDSLTGYEHAETSKGLVGYDIIDGGSGNDDITGGAGDDIINGGSGNDDITGGAGDDIINGGSGDDDITGGTGDDIINGGSGDDDITGGTGDDIINGGSGNDDIAGGAGDDIIDGGSGNDQLYGEAGDDVLDGGAGNDILRGGYNSYFPYEMAGNDTYIFGKGYGTDTIYDIDTTEGNLDVIEMKADVSATEVSLKRNGNNLEVTIDGTEDKLIVANYFSGSYYYNNDVTKRVNKVEEIRFADGTVWDVDYVENEVRTIIGSESNDSLIGYEYGETLEGLAGDDYITGGAGDDVLDGGSGNDQLYGEAGDDVLDGGAGNDILRGGYNSNFPYEMAGNDTYIFGKGYGTDTIYDIDTTEGNLDVIEMKADVSASEVSLKRNGNNLEVTIDGTEDKLIVANYFSGSYYYNNDVTKRVNKVEEIRFADGTVWDVDYVENEVRTIIGSESNDSLTGYEYGETLEGLAGDDYITGGAGDDVLDGGAGNDQLYGEEGDDVLDGGAGNDILRGGYNSNFPYEMAGNDTYIFGKGYGTDTIYDIDTTEGNLDVIEMKADVSASEVSLEKNGNNLELTIDGTEDKLIVANYFSGSYYYNNDVTKRVNKVEEIRFADGTVWDVDYVENEVTTMLGSESKDSLTGDDSTGGNMDEFIFSEESTNLIFERVENKLEILSGKTENSVTAESWFDNNQYQIGKISCQDGKSLTNTDVLQLIEAMADFTTQTGMLWEQGLENDDKELKSMLTQFWSHTE